MVRAYRAVDIRQAVRRLAAERPVPGVDIELRLAVLELQEELEKRVAAPQISEAAARARIEAGQPLTDGSAAGVPGELPRAAERMYHLLERRRGELEPALYPAVVTLALRGLLRPWATALAPLVDQERWLRAQCPVCGGVPDVAVIAGPSRERRLLCSQCDAEWACSRIGCPFCGTEEPDLLGYYAAAEGPYRLYVCDGCKSYLKAVDVPRGERCCPPADRIFATPLELAAARLGYSARESGALGAK